MTVIDADLLMAYIAAEAKNRQQHMKPTDSGGLRMADLAFVEALELVAQYVLAATGRDAKRPPTLREIEEGVAS